MDRERIIFLETLFLFLSLSLINLLTRYIETHKSVDHWVSPNTCDKAMTTAKYLNSIQSNRSYK